MTVVRSLEATNPSRNSRTLDQFMPIFSSVRPKPHCHLVILLAEDVQVGIHLDYYNHGGRVGSHDLHDLLRFGSNSIRQIES